MVRRDAKRKVRPGHSSGGDSHDDLQDALGNIQIVGIGQVEKPEKFRGRQAAAQIEVQDHFADRVKALRQAKSDRLIHLSQLSLQAGLVR